MKRTIILLVILLVGSLLLAADVTQVDTAGIGSPKVQPQVVAAVPAQPYVCDINQRGRIIYVDDTNDTNESFLCFCGTDADDSSYIWMKVEDPNTNCF